MFSIDDAPDELAYEIKRYVDWSWDEAASISFLESGWRWETENDTTEDGLIPCGTPIDEKDGVTITSEHSISYFQINACNYPDWEWQHFFNVRQNVGTAHALWQERGWTPWYFSATELGLI